MESSISLFTSTQTKTAQRIMGRYSTHSKEQSLDFIYNNESVKDEAWSCYHTCGDNYNRHGFESNISSSSVPFSIYCVWKRSRRPSLKLMFKS
ncbi:hypothetical protein D623_10015898 [Myotis brandtii]|uniref:Uncharacterized protein n=1 Tax=Myotis brandtii TaxID=109478 RepID=S7MMR4_MYOBR|nr:hypothetical protein D623_10015898 [Myotis brandtii]